MVDWEPAGFIRQEESKYYLRNLIGAEGLAYDFDVSIGDTVQIGNPFGALPVSALVTNIDSVQIEPGNEMRKRITLLEYQYYFNEEYWIEGIGSGAGLTVSGMDMTLLTGGDDYTLLCYYELDELLFQTELYSLCFYPIVDVPMISDNGESVNLFPNPVQDRSLMIVPNPENKDYSIIFRDFSGKIIRKSIVYTTSTISIDEKEFSKGIYFYSIECDTKLVFAGKFIVQ